MARHNPAGIKMGAASHPRFSLQKSCRFTAEVKAPAGDFRACSWEKTRSGGPEKTSLTGNTLIPGFSRHRFSRASRGETLPGSRQSRPLRIHDTLGVPVRPASLIRCKGIALGAVNKKPQRGDAGVSRSRRDNSDRGVIHTRPAGWRFAHRLGWSARGFTEIRTRHRWSRTLRLVVAYLSATAPPREHHAATHPRRF
jgi:hypothetical protein